MASVSRSSSSLCIRRAGTCHLAVLLLALAAAPRHVGAAVERGGEPGWHVVAVSTLLPSTVCTGTAASTAALSVMHRHGSCSPLHSRGGGPPPSHDEILRRDRRRVESIHHRIMAAGASVETGGVSLPVRWGTSLGDNNYIITVGLGTPAREFSVELDTGSDLSWVQCTPCRGCYGQRDPLFDPARSSTFSPVPCGAPACQGFAAHNCSSITGAGQCGYEFPYADGSVAKGNLVRDTLTLLPSSETLPGFVFGCGHADTGHFGETDGLFGLARDRVSLFSQAAGRYGARFSYCLPSTSSAVGYLSLGGAAPPANAQFTAMMSRGETGMPSLYYVNLVGISVAGVAIDVAPAAFMRAGTIIDSGTVITYLPPRAYAALRSAFTRSMSKYKRAPPLDYLDTCYDFTGVGRVRIPAVALVFADGATVNLDTGGVMYVSTVAQTCLAYAANDDETYVGVLGNMLQKTFTVVYDVGNQKIGFAAKGCS